MLINTSGFFALNSEKDRQHEKAKEIYLKSWLRLTTNYVLDEYVALASARKLPRPKTINFSQEILNDATIEIVWVNEELHRQAIELLRQRPDKYYSLCDAVSFTLMHERGITEALTTDHHFEQESFIRLLK